jgi:hypothetical protein
MKRGLTIGIVVVVIIAIALGLYFYFGNNSSPNPSTCAKAGEISFNDATGEVKECCSGLKEVGNLPDGTPEECANFANMEGFGSICTDCGNSNCESWENRCICPADCQ